MTADRDQVVAWAQQVRADRDELRRRLAASELSLSDCLDRAGSEPWAATYLGVVLESLPGARKVDTRRALAQLGIPPTCPVGGLDVADRRRVTSTFPLPTPAPGRLLPAVAVLVVSGPGGVGKGTITAELLRVEPALWVSRSWTTREPRVGEDPEAYHFATRSEFEERIAAGGFLEWVEFLDYLQGSPLPEPPVGCDVMFEIDVAGAATVQQHYPEAALVFIDTPDLATQEARLRGRGDAEDRINQRLERAAAERASAAELGATTIINDDLPAAVAEVRAVLERARAAARRRAAAPASGG